MILFASDFDDTLFFHDGRGLQAKDVRKIREFQTKGNCFALCTGRPASMFTSISAMIQNQIQFDFRIFSNGAVITRNDGEILFSVPLEYEFIRYALQTWPDVNFMLHTQKGLQYTHHLERDGGTILSDQDRQKIQSQELPVYEMSVDWHVPQAYEALQDLKKHPKAACYENSYVADFVNPNVSKATGIAWLKSYLHADQAYAMGDSWNDIPMIESTRGFTFHSSSSEVKQAASRTFDCVAEALEYISTHNQH